MEDMGTLVRFEGPGSRKLGVGSFFFGSERAHVVPPLFLCGERSLARVSLRPRTGLGILPLVNEMSWSFRPVG